jgi:hypothetical protein
MEFCSKYGYDYGFQGSDEEDLDDEMQQEKEQKKKVRKADSNIIAVKFDELTVSNETFPGEIKRCSHCSAIPNCHSLASNITTDHESANNLIWKCEFCDHINKLESTNINEISKQEDVTYLVEPALTVPPNTESSESSKDIKSTDDNFLTYCIDISGSMDTRITSSNNEQRQNQMTRLNGVKIACLENLNILKDSEPNKRCSLVTFSDSIKYFGDGSKSSYHEPLINTSNRHYSQQQQQQQGRFSQRLRGLFSINNNQPQQQNQNEIASDILTNKEKMLALGTNQPNDLKGISKSFDKLKNIIEHLRTEGSTALGPGLVFSIGHSSKKEGSQIILCTDGAANIGMGSIGNNNDSEQFYDDLADYSKTKSIQINIVTMEGTDCKLAFLGRLADKTNGTMNIVNPANLSDQFKSILENRIVATNVKATLIVNEKYLYIRDKDLEIEEGKVINEFGNRQAGLDRIEKFKKSKITTDIGNATMDTDITFEYGIRRQDNNKETVNLSELPFQLQIEYTYNGAKFLRVYTKKQKFTKIREEALENVVANEILFAHNMQMMSNQAMSNNIGYAQFRSNAMNKMARGNPKMALPSAMIQQQQMQSNLFMRNANISSYNDTEADVMLKCKKMARKNLF